MKRLFCVVNPAAGGNTCLKRFAAVEAVLTQKNIPYTAVYSEYAGHASELTRQAIQSGCDCVVAAGGDGTVREVARELLHTGIPMGILPFGTGNDFIRALQIPTGVDEALELLLNGTSKSIDAAMANDQLYVNVAGFGFDVDVLEKTLHYKTRFRGIIPYLLGILHALLRLRSHRVKITMSQGTVIEDDVLLVAVGNGTHIGGGMCVTPRANPSDGLLDICVVQRVRRLELLRFLPRFIKGRHLELGISRYFQVQQLTVESTPETIVQLDGELIEKTPVIFQSLPHSLQIICGPFADSTQGSSPASQNRRAKRSIKSYLNLLFLPAKRMTAALNNSTATWP